MRSLAVKSWRISALEVQAVVVATHSRAYVNSANTNNTKKSLIKSNNFFASFFLINNCIYIILFFSLLLLGIVVSII